ncbi:MAG TPA: hypothetical protein VII64_09695 [Thermodesulfobacteriota bacterium]
MDDKILAVSREAARGIRANGYNKVFCYKRHRGSIPETRIETIPEDFYSAIDFLKANNRACSAIDILCERILADRAALRPLRAIGGEEYAGLFIRKALLTEAEKICRYVSFARKVRGSFGVKGRVDLIPGPFSSRVYSSMKAAGLIQEGISIPERLCLMNGVRERVRNNLYRARLAIYPELVLTGARKRKPDKRHYRYALLLHDGRGFVKNEGSMDFMVDGKKVKAEEILYLISERPGSGRAGMERLKSGAGARGYAVASLDEPAAGANLKGVYSRAAALRPGLLALTLKYPEMSGACSNAMKEFLLWELFHGNYGVEKIVSIQHPARLTGSFIARRRGIENVFLHSSVVFDRLDRSIGEGAGKAEQCYYSHHAFDAACSDRLSNEWLKNSQNAIRESVDIGPVFSDIVFEARVKRKSELREAIGVPSGSRLVSFFDSTVGHNGVLTLREEEEFIRSARLLLDKDPGLFIAFRFKNRAAFDGYSGDALKKETELLFANPGCVCANDLNVSNFELMGASDLVVSAPLSSVIFESLVGGVPSVYYDPLGRYREPHYFIERLPMVAAHGREELEAAAAYWLSDSDGERFESLKEEYLKRYVDRQCDGNASERFRDVLLRKRQA